MPVAYAHDRFGRTMLSACPELLGSVKDHPGLFRLGLQGPDLLYFYHPLRENSVKRLGYDLHRNTGERFFTSAAQVFRQSPDREAAKAYLLGLFCHFLLDSTCHPAVNAFQTNGLSHTGIEAAFDRHLMVRDGLDPLTYKPADHLRPNAYAAAVIAPFYPPLSVKTMFRCQKGYRFYMNLIVAKGPKRRALGLVMALVGKPHLAHWMVPCVADPRYADSDAALTQRYADALTLGEKLLPWLLAHLEKNAPLGPDFGKTFAGDA